MSSVQHEDKSRMFEVLQFQRTIRVILSPEVYHVTNSNNKYHSLREKLCIHMIAYHIIYMTVYLCMFDINIDINVYRVISFTAKYSEGTRTLVTKLKYFPFIHMSPNHDGSYSLLWFHESSILSVQTLQAHWSAPKFLPVSNGCSKLQISPPYLAIITPHTKGPGLLWLINRWEKLILRRFKTQWTPPGPLWHTGRKTGPLTTLWLQEQGSRVWMLRIPVK